MKTIKKIFLSLALIVGLGVTLAPAAGAVNIFDACDSASDTAVCQGRDEQVNGFVRQVVNTMMYILGALSVIMIIVAGIMYVTSGGSSDQVNKARHTLTYSVVGLIVALLALAIINFVLGRFSGS